MASKAGSKNHMILCWVAKESTAFLTKWPVQKCTAATSDTLLPSHPPPCRTKEICTLFWKVSVVDSVKSLCWKLLFHFMFRFIAYLFKYVQILADFIEICNLIWWSCLAVQTVIMVSINLLEIELCVVNSTVMCSVSINSSPLGVQGRLCRSWREYNIVIWTFLLCTTCTSCFVQISKQFMLTA